MITRENYEIYFADYLDGTLPPSDIRELKTFLILNPDLEELLEDTNRTKLSLPEIKYRNKKALKKEIIHECPDYYAIAAAENSLTDEDRIQLGHNIKNTDLQELISTYKNIKFNSDQNIHFEKKHKLYRKKASSVIVFRKSSIAAVILLLLGIGIAIFHPLNTVPEMDIPPVVRTLPVSPLPSIEPLAISEHAVQPVICKPEAAPVKFTVTKEEKIITKEEINVAEIIPIRQITIISNDELSDLSLKSKKMPDKAYPEIMLSKDAGEWRPSYNNIQGKNIFTSTVNAGKNIVEKIRSKNLGIENIFSE